MPKRRRSNLRTVERLTHPATSAKSSPARSFKRISSPLMQRCAMPFTLMQLREGAVDVLRRGRWIDERGDTRTERTKRKGEEAAMKAHRMKGLVLLLSVVTLSALWAPGQAAAVDVPDQVLVWNQHAIDELFGTQG